MSAKNVLHIFETIDTEEKAYWLGFLYADGAVGSAEAKVELGLAAKDLHHIEKFRDFIGIDNKISYRDSTNSYRYAFRRDANIYLDRKYEEYQDFLQNGSKYHRTEQHI